MMEERLGKGSLAARNDASTYEDGREGARCIFRIPFEVLHDPSMELVFVQRPCAASVMRDALRFCSIRSCQMPDIELTRSHSLGLDDGREAVERVAQDLETDLGVRYEWDNNTLLFGGQGAKGEIEVEPDTIQILINLSGFLKPMKGRLKEEAEQYLDRYLDER